MAISIYAASLVYVLSFSWQRSIPAHADAALVLGAKVNLDETPSAPLYYRTIEASKLFTEKKVDYVMTTGGQGLGLTAEGTEAGIIAEQHGVPTNKVLTEQQSHNTFENVEDVVTLAAKYQIKSVVVVSDRFHVARGVLVAKHFGFTPVSWDFPDAGYYKTSQLISNYAREAAAMLYYLPKIAFSPSQ